MSTIEDFRRIVRNRIRSAESTTLDVGSVDKPGSVFNILAAAAAALGLEVDSRNAARMAARLSASAVDADLDRLITEESWGELPRLDAAAATWSLRLSRTGTGAGTVPAGAQLKAGGLVWTLDSPVVFAANDLGPKLSSWTCTTAGTAGNMGPSSLEGLANAALLFDPSLTVAAIGSGSDAYSAGGNEREGDVAYRARRAVFDAGLDRNEDLLRAGAISTPGIVFATAVPDLAVDGSLIGTVTLYIADVNGRANAALIERVRARLRSFRMAGQHVNIIGAAPSFQSIGVHYAVAAGVDQAATLEAVRAAIVAYVNKLPPGATLTIAGLTGVLVGVPGVVLESSVPDGIVSPLVDVAPTSLSTMFRTAPELVSFS